MLLASASEAFTTSLRPPTDGKPFAPDFGARKMERDMEILDMPVRKLPDAWNACVEAALSAKVAVEEEITKARDMQVCLMIWVCACGLTVAGQTEHIKRTFDYEPFITQFITCMQDEGLLDAAMGKGPAKDSPKDDAAAQEPVGKAPAKRGRKPKPKT